MINKPKITNYDTARNLGGPGPRIVKGIVLHDTAGSGYDGDTRYLVNDPENLGISVDFTVNRDGLISQLNPDLETRWTFHAGRNTSFKGLKNVDVNKGTIGIEILQKANLSLVPIWPTRQVKSVALLCVYLCERFSLRKEDITTHAQVITDGSRSDPRKWPWLLFWSEFNFIGEGVESVSTGPVMHIVVKGDTLWSLSVKYQTKIEVLKAVNNLNIMSNHIYLGQSLIVKE